MNLYIQSQWKILNKDDFWFTLLDVGYDETLYSHKDRFYIIILNFEFEFIWNKTNKEGAGNE